jgi:hypothetical protein
MATIDVTARDDNTFDVTVHAGSTTNHTVTVTDAYHRKLAGDAADKAALVRASFEFLLEREPNTSILGRFDLPVIGRYFPEYEKQIGTRL